MICEDCENQHDCKSREAYERLFEFSNGNARCSGYEPKKVRGADTNKFEILIDESFRKLIKAEIQNSLTLDEAIKHCYEVARVKCDNCGKEHLQLAEWLKELKMCRDIIARQQAEIRLLKTEAAEKVVQAIKERMIFENLKDGKNTKMGIIALDELDNILKENYDK